MGLNVDLVLWKNNIKQVGEIVYKIISNKSVEHVDIMSIRSLIYQVYITNIDENEIINELFFELNNRFKENKIFCWDFNRCNFKFFIKSGMEY
jgi:hypothetical protein